MIYFLTGGTGCVGGRVARQLREAGHEVVAIARDPGRAQDLRDLGVAVHAGDITDLETLRAPTSRSEMVRDNAGVTYLGDNAKARRVLGYQPRPLDDGLRETLAYKLAQMRADGGGG